MGEGSAAIEIRCQHGSSGKRRGRTSSSRAGPDHSRGPRSNGSTPRYGRRVVRAYSWLPGAGDRFANDLPHVGRSSWCMRSTCRARTGCPRAGALGKSAALDEVGGLVVLAQGGDPGPLASSWQAMSPAAEITYRVTGGPRSIRWRSPPVPGDPAARVRVDHRPRDLSAASSRGVSCSFPPWTLATATGVTIPGAEAWTS
jgi:hypothetical protein